MVSSSQTSVEAWNKLKNLYASQSCSRIMGLKETFIKLSRGSSSVGDYLCHIKGIVDDLTLAGDPPNNDIVVLHTPNGLGSEFKEISAAIRGRDIVISLEELQDKLIEYESFLK
ncbi:hypothetical protein Ddye_000471 [Dipteronia dyeriana]|uniref:Uncharacterized protein n=1 Tax=Dipteronia dyeriana TaxID=168575 RepID=A0AAD9XM50_9ROSI|nr:hypothetical protein Ddye_000471 [Dipteronia dyeriana]